MAVTLYPPSGPYCFRICRTWNGNAIQRYVPFGKDMEKARKEADKIDASLAQRQRAYRMRRDIEGLDVVNADTGLMVGVQFRYRVYRDGRPYAPMPMFHARIQVGGNPKVFKTYEVNSKRSFDEAFF